MKNKIVLITGGNSGIGKATSLGLAKLGATVVIACRNKEKGQQAVADIKKDCGNQNIDLLMVDLASQKSVRAAAEEFKSRYKHESGWSHKAGDDPFYQKISPGTGRYRSNRKFITPWTCQE